MAYRMKGDYVERYGPDISEELYPLNVVSRLAAETVLLWDGRLFSHTESISFMDIFQDKFHPRNAEARAWYVRAQKELGMERTGVCILLEWYINHYHGGHEDGQR